MNSTPINPESLEAAARAICAEWHDGTTYLRRPRQPATWNTVPDSTRDAFLRDARAAITAFIAAEKARGRAMVPRDSTSKMRIAGNELTLKKFPDVSASMIWREMFDAASSSDEGATTV